MHSDRTGSQLCSQNCCWSSFSDCRHKTYMTQNSPCPGGKKSVFLLVCLSIASSIPFAPVAFQRQIVNTAMCGRSRPWLLTWKVLSEKIKYLPQVTQWSWLQNQILLHINISDPPIWGAKIPFRIPDYILVRVARSYILPPHLLILRVVTRFRSVAADQVKAERLCTNKGV